jgi:hypothetical protein
MSIQLTQSITVQLAPPESTPYRVVSAPDENIKTVRTWPTTGSAWATIGAVCTTASSTLTFRLVAMDLEGNVTYVGPTITLTTGSGAADCGTVWLATPSMDPTVSVSSDLIAMKVDSVSGGTWTVNAAAFTPAPTTPIPA